MYGISVEPPVCRYICIGLRIRSHGYAWATLSLATVFISGLLRPLPPSFSYVPYYLPPSRSLFFLSLSPFICLPPFNLIPSTLIPTTFSLSISLSSYSLSFSHFICLDVITLSFFHLVSTLLSPSPLFSDSLIIFYILWYSPSNPLWKYSEILQRTYFDSYSRLFGTHCLLKPLGTPYLIRKINRM